MKSELKGTSSRITKIALLVLPYNSKQRIFAAKIYSYIKLVKLKGLKYLWRYIQKEAQSAAVQQSGIKIALEKYKNIENIVIFLPSIGWYADLFQRPQQMAAAFARQNCLVFYFDRFLEPDEFIEIQPGLFLAHLPTSAFKTIHAPVVISYVYNSEWIPTFSHPRVVYEYIDDLSIHQDNEARYHKNHIALCKTAEIVSATAVPLQRQLEKNRPNAILNPNGVDYDHFKTARENITFAPPPDLGKVIQPGDIVIGYYGAFSYWFDYELLKAVANLKKNYKFLLLGRDERGDLKNSGCLKISNIFWLGVKAYQELPNYLAYFDVAIIPFIVSDLTNGTSPVKLYEYMAGHKPVVITPMYESMNIAGVLSGATPDEFVARLEEALKLSEDPAYIAIIDQVARENTWDARAKMLVGEIQKKQKNHITGQSI